MTKRFLKKYFIYIGAILSIADIQCFWLGYEDTGSDEEMAIFDAIHAQNLDEVRRIIDEHPNAVNARNEYGFTPLYESMKDLNLMLVLLQKGADVHATMSIHDATVLHSAVSSPSNLKAMKALRKYGADVNAKDAWGKTPMHSALEIGGSINVLRFLTTHDADVRAKDTSGRTPLHYACKSASGVDIVLLLLKHGAQVNDPDNNDAISLHHATKRHYPFSLGGKGKAIVLVLLADGAEVNRQDNDGKTPLHYASQHAPLDVMGVLLHHGADVNAQDKQGKTPLHAAANSQFACYNRYSPDAVLLLINAGADVNAQDENGKTPLHDNIILDRGSAALHLLKHGARVNAQDNDGKTPLFHAVAQNNLESAQLLLFYGADVDIIDISGQPLLQQAVTKLCTVGGFEILFEGKTPNIEVLNNTGESALFVALKKGHHEEFSILIERYATLTRSELRKGKDCWIARVMELLQQRKAILLSSLEHTELPRDLHMVIYGFVTEV